MKKSSFFYFSVPCIALFVLFGVWLNRTASADDASVFAYPPVKVATAVTEEGIARRSFSGIGELQALRQIQVAAEVSGLVTRIGFASGQIVEAGQVLVQLNDAPEQADRLRLQAQLKQTDIQLARIGQLLKEKAASQEQWDNAVAARDMAAGSLQHTNALIAQKTIRAPFSGVVGIRLVHEGQYLAAAEPIASLVNAEVLHVNFSLDEQSSIELVVGQRVELTLDAYPQRIFEAEISAIDPLIGKSRTVQVQATLANNDGLLKAGMYASIRVARSNMPAVLLIPETAVTYTAYGETVFVIDELQTDGLRVRRVAVSTGERQDGRIEITGGLRAGERVVTSGQIRLSEGSAVEILAEDSLQLTSASTANSHQTEGGL